MRRSSSFKVGPVSDRLGQASACLFLLAAVLLAAPAANYSIARSNGVDWLRSPSGELLFSNGVNVVDEKRGVERLRSWGFNTLGPWTDAAAERSRMPFTVELHIGGSLNVPWNDLFAPEFVAGAARAAAEAAAKYRGNPRLIGYFPDNELAWWGSAIFLYHLGQPQTSATRQRLVAILREHYQGEFTRLEQDFETPGATTWRELESAAKPRLWLRARKNGMQAISKFTAAVAERYYEVICAALRQADPGRLILGDRYASYYDAAVARAAGRHLDVVSTNYGADFLDGSLTRFFLDALHRITGRPLLVSEYYFCARENRTGNTNDGALFPTVETQTERAAAFAKNLTALSNRPYVVGAHWFQYRDEPKGGRPADGEDYNMGLVDFGGQPYEELVDASSRLHVANLHRQTHPMPIRTVVPEAPTNPWAGLMGWPRDQGFVTPLSPDAPADLYVCRSRDALWLGVTFMDYINPNLYRDAAQSQQDLPRLKIDIGEAEPILVEARAVDNVHVSKPGIRATFTQRGLRHTFIVQLPQLSAVKCELRTTGGASRAQWSEKW